MTSKKLGEKIAILRNEAGFSQEKLASSLDVKQSTISKIENGKWNITLSYLEAILDILGYEIKFEKKSII